MFLRIENHCDLKSLVHHREASQFNSFTIYFKRTKGNGNPLQYSCLENSMDSGAWQAAFHGVGSEESDTAE